MLSVTFSQPIVIEAAALHALLSLANAPATVEPYLNGHATPAAGPAPAAEKRARKPKAEAAPSGEEPAKRTRRTKAEMEAARANAASGVDAAAQTTEAETAAAKTPEAAPKAKPGRKPKAEAGSTETATAATSAEVSTEGLLERFAKLIDSDFNQAKAVLDQFGVNRFSDVKPADIAAFSAKLTELGV